MRNIGVYYRPALLVVVLGRGVSADSQPRHVSVHATRVLPLVIKQHPQSPSAPLLLPHHPVSPPPPGRVALYAVHHQRVNGGAAGVDTPRPSADYRARWTAHRCRCAPALAQWVFVSRCTGGVRACRIDPCDQRPAISEPTGPILNPIQNQTATYRSAPRASASWRPACRPPPSLPRTSRCEARCWAAPLRLGRLALSPTAVRLV